MLENPMRSNVVLDIADAAPRCRAPILEPMHRPTRGVLSTPPIAFAGGQYGSKRIDSTTCVTLPQGVTQPYEKIGK